MAQELVNELLRAAVIESADDPAYFCRFFLPHWFPTPLAPFQLGLLAQQTRKVSFLEKYPDAIPWLLENFKYMADPSDPEGIELPVFQYSHDGHLMMVAGPNNCDIIPRGFSKTTLYNAGNLYDCATDGSTFSVYISESSTHSETQLGNIRHELESNDKLRAAYGDVVPTRADSEKWTSNQLQLRNGAVLVARGRGAQIRGINYRGRRPNKILLDDVEDKESVSTPEQRKKVIDWFYGSVFPAGNEMSGAKDSEDARQEPLQITILGTLLGPETLLTTVAEDPTFNTVKFGATLPKRANNDLVPVPLEELSDRHMLWPYKMNARDYKAKRRQYAMVGQLSNFALEFDSTVRADEDAKFARHNVKSYIVVPRSDFVQVSMALDPAISDQPGRDHTALIVAGRREADGLIVILDEWGGLGKTPREKIDAFFEYSLRWGVTKHGIEAQQYQRALIFLMQEEMGRRQRFFTIEPIIQGAQQRKDDRIVGILAPRYSNGYIKHRRPFPGLEGNLLDWPNGKKDYADAAAMALTLLGETQMLVMPGDAITLDTYGGIDSELPPLYSDSDFIFNPQPDPIKQRYG
jgi:hypothetical protein